MKGKVVSYKLLDYADVYVVNIECEGVKAKIDVPIKLLNDLKLSLREGQEVDIEFSKELGEVEPWDIVLSGKVYKVEGDVVRASFGGLIALIEGAPGFKVRDKLYLKIKFLR